MRDKRQENNQKRMVFIISGPFKCIQELLWLNGPVNSFITSANFFQKKTKTITVLRVCLTHDNER